MSGRDLRVLIMAGGTGGHVFPGLAVAATLVGRGASVSWLGTRGGIEARTVPAAGYAFAAIDIAGLRGKRLWQWLVAPLSIARAIVKAAAVIRRDGAQVVVCMGGFAAGPGGVAAWLLGRPLVIHEQNAAAGLTNRLLVRIARTVLQAVPDTFAARFAPITVGNPVRRDIRELPGPSVRWRDRTGPIRLLVLGGSGGALAINETVPAALALLSADARPQVRHQAGRTLAQAQAAYQTVDIDADVTAFIDDMAAAYAWADLVICRSGALTVAELAAAGVAAILVPYPFAADDHQRANGAMLVEAGAAELFDQAAMTATGLAAAIERLCASRETLLARAENANRCAWRRADQDIADHVMAAAGDGS